MGGSMMSEYLFGDWGIEAVKESDVSGLAVLSDSTDNPDNADPTDVICRFRLRRGFLGGTGGILE